jgi:pentatricopeptide repeat protein
MREDEGMYSALMYFFLKGDMTEAKKWYEEMKKAEIKPNDLIFSLLITGASKLRDGQSFHYWFDEMKRV